MSEVLPVSVTVILPTRNEEEALGPTIDAIPRGWCEDLEIMIVDGNSTDRTREIALEKDIRVHRILRRYDEMTWPHATRGFFKLKEKIPKLITELDLG